MRSYIQYLSVFLFVVLVTKSFYKPVTYIDAVSIICLVVLYCAKEFMEDKNTRIELSRIQEFNKQEIERLEKDLKDTKNYMSKVSANAAFVRK